MKKIKRMISLVMAFVMAMSLTAMTVLAADETTYTITIKNDASGYTYAAYQIFAGTLYEETTTDDTGETTTTKILSDITWGSGISDDGQTALQDLYKVSSAAELAELLEAGELSAHDFAVAAGQYIVTNARIESESSEGIYTISGLAAGYYLVKNTAVPDVDGAYTSYILEVVSDVEVAPKESVPTSDKRVDDYNDSTGNSSLLDTSADHDIGDEVNFTLTHNALQSDYDDYDTYILIFHDVMSKGLTFNENSVVVTVNTDGVDYIMNSDSYSVTTDCTDNCTFEIQITDLKTTTSTNGSTIPTNTNSTITVTYTGTLNSNAVIGNPGNPNTMYTEYSDNPYASGSGEDNETDRTPDHTVAVFTYQVVVNKVDENKDPLAGAEFTLYKYILSGSEEDESTGWVAYRNALTVDSTGVVFTATGLDDGWYKIVETKAPDGYNSIDDIYFEVIAEHKEDTTSETGYSTSLTVTLTDADGNTISETTPTFTINSENNGEIDTTIENHSGSELPSTGGIGTTIFRIIGILLILGAAVMLVTKFRMGKSE